MPKVSIMHIESLKAPTTFKQMLKSFDEYYNYFYHEMVRMSNTMLNDYLEQFLSVLKRLSKSPLYENVFRSALGITALKIFGYRDFARLVALFDRVVPQRDHVLVKFTSWCAGKLIHHPNSEQSLYVAHLFNRVLGWLHAHGRRERHFAAAAMIRALSSNAGNFVVIFIPQIKAAANVLLNHPSFTVIKETMSAFDSFTTAVMRYRRTELSNYLTFLLELCLMLLHFGNPDKENAALLLLSHIVKKSPQHFLTKFTQIVDSIEEIYYTSPEMVKSSSTTTLISLSLVDPVQFEEQIAGELTEKISSSILEFPEQMVYGIELLSKSYDELIRKNPGEYTRFASDLINHQLFNEAMHLLTVLLKVIPESIIELVIKEQKVLIEAPICQSYNSFFSNLSQICCNLEGFNKGFLSEKLKAELLGENPVLALELIASLPKCFFPQDHSFFEVVSSLSYSNKIEIRCTVPRAIFNIIDSSYCLSKILIDQINRAIADPELSVRRSILEVIYSTCPQEIAHPEILNQFQVFVNDDSATVRAASYRILEIVFRLNPMMTTSILRRAILDDLFILKQVSSIRQRARIARILPYLFKASVSIIEVYSSSFFDIFFAEFPQSNNPDDFHNFVEENAKKEILIGLVNSFTLIAQIESKRISDRICQAIPILSKCLSPFEDRKLLLAILHSLLILLTPPVSNQSIRSYASMILQECSKFLQQTTSRKARIATLKVIGAIGLADIQEKVHLPVCINPLSVDDELFRQFYHPVRDSELQFDDSLLIEKNGIEKYFIGTLSTILLRIFDDSSHKDLYILTARALSRVFDKPPMFILFYFDSYLIKILSLMRDSNNEDLNQYMAILTDVIEKSGWNVVPFLSQIISIIEKRYNHDLMISSLLLIESLIHATKDAFVPLCQSTLCLLLNTLDDCKTSQQYPCEIVLRIFPVLGIFAGDQLYLIVPQVCDVIVCEQTIQSVRILAIQSLQNICQNTDIYIYMGTIIRALSFSLNYSNSETLMNAQSLLCVLIAKYGDQFRLLFGPVLLTLKASGKDTEHVSQLLVDTPSIPKKTILKEDYKPPKEDMCNLVSNESLVISIASNPNFGSEQHLEQWLFSLIYMVISSSPRSSIRACAPLATASNEIALNLFKPAFYSLWQRMKEPSRCSISKGLQEILSANEIHTKVVREIIGLIVFLHKIDQPLQISTSLIVDACIRYNCLPFALKLQEDLFQSKSSDPSVIIGLIDVLVNLGQWENAISIFEVSERYLKGTIDVFASLRFFDKAVELYSSAFKKSNDPTPFVGLIQSLNSSSQWSKVLEYLPRFFMMNRQIKNDTAPAFAKAALYLRDWDTLDKVMHYSPKDSVLCNCISALNHLKKREFDKVDDCFEHGFSLIASKPIAFWGEGKYLQEDIVFDAQLLIEIHEMKQLLQKSIDKNSCFDIWNYRMQMSPKKFDLWYQLISQRSLLIDTCDENTIELFEIRNKGMDKNLYNIAYQILFPLNKEDEFKDVSRICKSISLWNTGNKLQAISHIEPMINSVGLGEIRLKCCWLYSTWVIDVDEPDSIQKAYKCLKSVMHNSLRSSRTLSTIDSPIRDKASPTKSLHKFTTYAKLTSSESSDILRVELLRKWAYINSELISIDLNNTSSYVSTAIKSLQECSIMRPSFPDVVHMLNLFFENAQRSDVFEETSHLIMHLDPKLLLQVSPQILIQLSHGSNVVSEFVFKIVYRLLLDHYHTLIFSVVVLKKSPNERRALAAKKLLDCFAQQKSIEMLEVELVRKTLLLVTVTWYEEVSIVLSDFDTAFKDSDYNKMVSLLYGIIELTKKPVCEMHRHFLICFREDLESLNSLLSIEDIGNSSFINRIVSWKSCFSNKFGLLAKEIKSIQLSSISQELDEKRGFLLAVPGTYKPSHPITRINCFIGHFSVYDSKQQPKGVVIKGENGSFYQYLLKGHEDLRLDERIMQFFRLINSLLKKERSRKWDLIQVMCVIPFSNSHGLVQWIHGTDTLKSIVEQYRTMKQKNTVEEYDYLLSLSHPRYDDCMSIQKLQIILKIFEIIPDTDIANFFWIKARDAENWLQQIQTFSISSAITSVIGYIIGLGDRHPSNILIDRFTGKVIHIDFGDCFERAMNRKYLPEVVPFRLTRMMVKAMGVTGYDGTFRSTFIDTFALLRENMRLLILVLAVFVHEPLVDPDNYMFSNRSPNQAFKTLPRTESTSDNMRLRIKQKLTGHDFGSKTPMSIEDQTDRLIKEATNPYNLSKLYNGWCPFW